MGPTGFVAITVSRPARIIPGSPEGDTFNGWYASAIEVNGGSTQGLGNWRLCHLRPALTDAGRRKANISIISRLAHSDAVKTAEDELALYVESLGHDVGSAE
jgi:hypothetical protein